MADPDLSPDEREHVVGLLVERLADDPLVAEVAAFAIGESLAVGPDALAAVETMAREHEAHLCREAAIAALGSLGAGRATILRALGRGDAPADRATVRRRAVIALAPFEGDDVEAALHAALDDRDWQVRQAAEDLLAIPDDELDDDLDDEIGEEVSDESETS